MGKCCWLNNNIFFIHIPNTFFSAKLAQKNNLLDWGGLSPTFSSASPTPADLWSASPPTAGHPYLQYGCILPFSLSFSFFAFLNGIFERTITVGYMGTVNRYSNQESRNES